MRVVLESCTSADNIKMWKMIPAVVRSKTADVAVILVS